MNSSRSFPSSQRGAVLIVALLLATGLAIAIGSYLSIARTNLKISGRAFHNNSAMNLAETGLEEALWSINRNLEGNTAAWTGWTLAGSQATRTFGPVDLGQNTAATPASTCPTPPPAAAPRSSPSKLRSSPTTRPRSKNG